LFAEATLLIASIATIARTIRIDFMLCLPGRWTMRIAPL
jgi:hypothetical protein